MWLNIPAYLCFWVRISINALFLLIFQTLLIGFLVSLSGSMPLGNLNITALQLAARERLSGAVWFAAGVTLVEMIYLRISIALIDLLNFRQQMLPVMNIISVVVLLFFATASFVAAAKKNGKNIIVENKLNRFVYGMFLSAVNPLQVPFWMGWVVYLLTAGKLKQELIVYNIFTLAAGTGTFCALFLFALLGKRLSAILDRYRLIVNIIFGCLFVVMALIQLKRIL